MSHKEEEILTWALDRNLIGPNGKATPQAQQDKTEEEAEELREAIKNNDLEGVIDGIGDVYVTLCIQAALWGLSMDQCIDHAYNEIKGRTGRMVDGVFVKDA